MLIHHISLHVYHGVAVARQCSEEYACMLYPSWRYRARFALLQFGSAGRFVLGTLTMTITNSPRFDEGMNSASKYWLPAWPFVAQSVGQEPCIATYALLCACAYLRFLLPNDWTVAHKFNVPSCQRLLYKLRAVTRHQAY
jgi:hypothetical protein